MLKGVYNAIKNSHAAAVLSKIPDIVGASSGMGDAERKSSVTMKFKPSAPAQAAKVSGIKTMDDTKYVGQGAQVTPEQFPKYYYMGEG